VARYDVYANPDTADRRQIPFMLDVQNDFLEDVDTRVVVPLWHAAAFPHRVRSLNPELEAGGKRVVMDTAAIGAVPLSELRRPLEQLSSQQLTIQDALDTLLGGY
jgi:toxin CcdB